MAKETFADRLKQAMDEKGKKQIDIIRAAAEQGVKLGKSHISQYVSGKNIPRTDILHCLAEVLGVDEEWLRGRGRRRAAEDRRRCSGRKYPGRASGRRDTGRRKRCKKCFPGDRRRWRDKKSRKFRRQTNERVQKIFKIEQCII